MVSPGSIFTDTAAFADEAAWHAAARELRRHRPLLRVEADGWPPFWALTRYDDVMEIERRPEVWLNTRRVFLQPIDQSAAQKASGTDMRMIIQMDDPDHKGYRGLTAAWFRPATLRQTMDSRLRELATRFVDQMAATGGTCDFASEIAKFYPLHVIMSILGVSESDEGRMLRLTQELLGPDDAELQRPGEERDQGLVETILDFFAYFQRLSADRRSTPTEDVASRIANGLVDGEPIGDLEAMSYYVILATAGHDTTSFALSGGMEALLREPDQLERLHLAPELAGNAAEEMIRWTSPVRHFMRYATQESEIHGATIPEGGRVLLSYPSANRDEEVFGDSMRFDINRPDADKLISFGLGAHFCLGSQFARREVRTMVAKLGEQLAHIELAGEPEWSASHFVSGVKHLPVTYAFN